jgi:hypothetical protein
MHASPHCVLVTAGAVIHACMYSVWRSACLDAHFCTLVYQFELRDDLLYLCSLIHALLPLLPLPQGFKPPFLFILNVQVPGTPPLSIVAWWALDADVIEQHVSSSSSNSSSSATTPATTAVQTPARVSRDTSSSSSTAVTAADTGARTDLSGSQQCATQQQQQQLQPTVTADSSSEVVSNCGSGSKGTSAAAAAATSSVFVSMLQRYAEKPGAASSRCRC